MGRGLTPGDANRCRACAGQRSTDGAAVRAINLRCVCEDRDLGEVLEIAKRKSWTTAAEVANGTGCGGNCRTCRPYIARMLATGRVPTVNDLMLPEELNRWRDA